MIKRIALVTGGMGGIGQAICRELHDQGYRVIAAYHRKPEAAKAWQDEQKQSGYEFDIIPVNVTDSKSCEEMAKKIEEEIGCIDILINNAGITHDVSCCKMSIDDWNSVINTDLNSIFYVTRVFISHMKQKGYGRIINISSINGQRGQHGQVNYCAAKAGIHGFTKALARELARHGITVNTVSPGYVLTDMVQGLPKEVQDKILAEIPVGRFAASEEVAHVIAFLAEEKNSYITGANIAINGGHYMV